MNEHQSKRVGKSRLVKHVAGGALAGAAVGAIAGPGGAGIGAVVGAIAGGGTQLLDGIGKGSKKVWSGIEGGAKNLFVKFL